MKPRVTTLSESMRQVDLSSSIDQENGVIHGVQVLGFESKNGYDYPAKVVEKAVQLYEGVEVNLGHIKDAGQERVLIDGWGVLKNPRFVASEGIKGDLHYLKTHPETPIVLERISRGFPAGLSHVAEAVMAKARKGKRGLVESIERVVSVDFVRKPATNTSLFESEDSVMKIKVRDLASKATLSHIKTLLESAPEELEIESTGDDAADVRLAAGAALEVSPPEEDPGDDDDDDQDSEKKESEIVKSLARSVEYLMEREKVREKSDLIRKVLDSEKINFADLSPDHQRLLESQTDEKDMVSLVRTWPPVVRGRRMVQEGSLGIVGAAKDLSELRSRLK